MVPYSFTGVCPCGGGLDDPEPGTTGAGAANTAQRKTARPTKQAEMVKNFIRGGFVQNLTMTQSFGIFCYDNFFLCMNF